MQLSVFAMDAELPLVREDSYAYRVGTGDMFCLHTPSTGEKAVLAFASESEVIEEFEKLGSAEGHASKSRPGTNWKYTIVEPGSAQDNYEGGKVDRRFI